MLTFFTNPYPNELLYSSIARYHFYSGNINKNDTIEELFGNRSMVPSLEIGSHFSTLVKNIGSYYSVEGLLSKHTIYPYYSPFISKERQENLFKRVHGNGSGIYESLGLTAGSFLKKEGIYYCSACAISDKKNYGEPYIHREHQLQGIDFCVHHEMRLKKYPIEFYEKSRNEYIRLEMSKIDILIEKVDDEEIFKELQIKLAQLSYCLLNKTSSRISIDSVIAAYRKELNRKNFMIGENKVNQNLFSEYFVNYFPKGFLEKYCSEVDFNKKYNWLREIVRNNKNLIHPFRHLLVMICLGIEVKDLEDHIPSNTHSKGDIKNIPNLERIEEGRKEIEILLSQNPQYTRSDLYRKLKRKYRYIMENDKEWFEVNVPKKRTKVQPLQIVDWEKRDLEYCEKIEFAYIELLNSEKRIRISKSSIGKRLNILTDLEKRISKLPRTKALLDKIIETRKDFHLRKAYMFINQMLEENKRIGISYFPKLLAIKAEHFKEIRTELEEYINAKTEDNKL